MKNRDEIRRELYVAIQKCKIGSRDRSAAEAKFQGFCIGCGAVTAISNQKNAAAGNLVYRALRLLVSLGSEETTQQRQEVGERAKDLETAIGKYAEVVRLS